MGKYELLMEMEEQREIETKAEACDRLFVLANDVLSFMYENGMSKEEVAEYLGATVDFIYAVEDEDVEAIIEQGGKDYG